jgi:glucose-1-phosphate adenylyltransferase
VIGVRSQVATGSTIKDSVIMGADYYDPGKRPSSIPTGIGPNCYIEGAILDKNVHIGEGVIIRPFARGVVLDRDNWFVRDGIVVISKNAEIEAGTRITPEDVNHNACYSSQHLDGIVSLLS